MKIWNFPQLVTNYIEAETRIYSCERKLLKAGEESKVKVTHDKLTPEELYTVVWKNPKRL